MSTTVAHQITLRGQTAFIALAASFVAVVLAVALPLALQSTKTVFVKSTTPTSSGHAPAPVSNTQLLRQSHGG